MDLIRPMDSSHDLKVSHNWGDIIRYSIFTVFQIYGYKGTPHVLPYQMPLKVGMAEILWHLGGLEETYLLKRSLGSIFPTCSLAHQFVITFTRLDLFVKTFGSIQNGCFPFSFL